MVTKTLYLIHRIQGKFNPSIRCKAHGHFHLEEKKYKWTLSRIDNFVRFQYTHYYRSKCNVCGHVKFPWREGNEHGVSFDLTPASIVWHLGKFYLKLLKRW